MRFDFDKQVSSLSDTWPFHFQRHRGGPVIVGGTQIGIKSYGDGKCEEAAIYTRISAYVNSGWIDDKIVP
jgi:secreted trypsin-like serine protease